MKWEKLKKLKKLFWPLFAAVVLSTELLAMADMVFLFWIKDVSLIELALMWCGILLATGCLLRWKTKRILAAICLIPIVAGVALGCAIAGWRSFASTAGYEFPDDGKEQIFAGRKVMLIVPHQDDDINVLGGTMEEYVRYGSTLYPVFVTNGDYLGMTERRYQEALHVFQQIGVPAEQVTFLGYGDDWQEGTPHLYNTAPGVVATSFAGKTETYGTALHPAYREGRSYTIDHLMEDLTSVILEYRPDVIFCSDYDSHIDHKALTLTFDKVMGQLLKDNPDYQPVVYKAYAYSTAWMAKGDYYGDNVRSTRNPFTEDDGQEAPVYRWEDRVRFPVDGSTLSRSLLTSDAFLLLKCYESQGPQEMADAVINGDKVAWRRRTDSLCLRAGITVSSGDGRLLQDFMLLENLDLRDAEHAPYDGVWMPDQEDTERTVTVTLENPSDLVSVVLYDHPSGAHNVRNARIYFEDGTVVETGALDPSGAATVIAVEKKDVSSFRIVLAETEGEEAGLSEVEAFADHPEADGRFMKLMDEEGNFLYDYLMAPEGTAELGLYLHGDLPEVSPEHYTVRTDGGADAAVLNDDVIRVNCPAGEKITLQVTCTEAGVSDTIVVRNPGALERFWTELWSYVEVRMYGRYCPYPHDDLLAVAVLRKAVHLIQRIL